MGPGAHHGTVRGLRANGPQWRIARRTKSRSTSPDHAVCGGLAIALLRNGFGLRRMSVQMAEVAISRQMFGDVLSLIARLRAPPPVSAQRTDSFRHAGQPAEHLPYVCLNLDGKIITAGDGEEPARHAPGRRCPSSPAVPVSARSGSNANRFNQGTGGGNRVSGSSPTLFSARVMSSCTVSKFKSAVFSMMAETMAPPACRVASWGLPLTIVALQPALIPALSERYFTIGKTAHNERRSSTGSGGTSPALLPRQGLALGAKPGQSYAPRVNKKSVALTIALASANSERLFDVP